MTKTEITPGKDGSRTGLRSYGIWSAMRSRCQSSTNKNYALYGGRGIKVCPEWRDYAIFLSDMGEPPSSKHSIDRIDNDGNYEPANCRWATQAEQCQNQKRTKLTSAKVAEIRATYELMTGNSPSRYGLFAKLAVATGVGYQLARNVCVGKTWPTSKYPSVR